LTDVVHEFSLQVGNGGEHTAGDDIALGLAEPQFNLVQPRRVGRSEVQVNLRMRRQEVLNRLALVRREVVDNHMDLFAAGLVDHDVGEERDEFSAGRVRCSLTQHLAGLGVERSIEGKRAVPEVLETVTLEAPRRKRQYRVLPIESLNRGLFIDTENLRVRRRIQIQPDDVGGRLLDVRIVRGPVSLDPMQLQPVLAPHARHHHVADLQTSGQFVRTPMSRAVRGRPSRRVQNARFQLRSEHRGDLPEIPAVQSCDPLLGEPFAPARHKAAAALDALGDFIPGMALSQQQDQPGTSSVFRPIRPAIGSPHQFHTFRIRQRDRVCHAREYSL